MPVRREAGELHGRGAWPFVFSAKTDRRGREADQPGYVASPCRDVGSPRGGPRGDRGRHIHVRGDFHARTGAREVHDELEAPAAPVTLARFATHARSAASVLSNAISSHGISSAPNQRISVVSWPT